MNTKYKFSLVIAMIFTFLASVSFLFSPSEKAMADFAIRGPVLSPLQGLEVEVIGSGNAFPIVGLPGGYKSTLTLGSNVEVLRFEITNNAELPASFSGTCNPPFCYYRDDLRLLKVTAHYTASGIDDFVLESPNAWALYNNNIPATPIAYGTARSGLVSFELNNDWEELYLGGPKEYFITTILQQTPASHFGRITVWLEEDSTTDSVANVGGAVDLDAETASMLNSYNFVFQSSVYGNLYNGGFVDSLPSYGQRLIEAW